MHLWRLTTILDTSYGNKNIYKTIFMYYCYWGTCYSGQPRTAAQWNYNLQFKYLIWMRFCWRRKIFEKIPHYYWICLRSSCNLSTFKCGISNLNALQNLKLERINVTWKFSYAYIVEILWVPHSYLLANFVKRLWTRRIQDHNIEAKIWKTHIGWQCIT